MTLYCARIRTHGVTTKIVRFLSATERALWIIEMTPHFNRYTEVEEFQSSSAEELH